RGRPGQGGAGWVSWWSGCARSPGRAGGPCRGCRQGPPCCPGSAGAEPVLADRRHLPGDPVVVRLGGRGLLLVLVVLVHPRRMAERSSRARGLRQHGARWGYGLWTARGDLPARRGRWPSRAHRRRDPGSGVLDAGRGGLHAGGRLAGVRRDGRRPVAVDRVAWWWAGRVGALNAASARPWWSGARGVAD